MNLGSKKRQNTLLPPRWGPREVSWKKPKENAQLAKCQDGPPLSKWLVYLDEPCLGDLLTMVNGPDDLKAPFSEIFHPSKETSNNFPPKVPYLEHQNYL